MNLIQLLLLTLAATSAAERVVGLVRYDAAETEGSGRTPFAAERVVGLARYDLAETEGSGRTAGVKGGANASGRPREVKRGMNMKISSGAAKGSSKGGSKGGSNGRSDCTTLSIYVLDGDIMDNAIDSEHGYATKFDVYAVGSQTVIASWYEQASYTDAAGTDGLGTIVLVWSGGASSISAAGVLRQRTLPITGGTGNYSCASGYIEATRQVGTRTFLDANYCLAC